jgi:hypothetical protein
MDKRRVVASLLGAWFALTLFMAAVATQNFRAVDRLLAAPAPEAAESLRALGPEGARRLLRYQASELNRFFFRRSEEAQLALWVVVLIVARDRWTRMLGSAVLVALLVEFLFLTPRIISLGRAMDFAPASALRPLFWRLHGAYSTLELVKWVLGAWLGWRLLATEREGGISGGSAARTMAAGH